MHKLDKAIDKLAREKGYPAIKLTYHQMMDVLKEAHRIVYTPHKSVKP